MANPLLTSLLAWYPFDGDTADYNQSTTAHAAWASGNGSYATSNNITNMGYSASFDGTTQPRLTTPSYGSQAIVTVAAMVRPTAFTNTFGTIYNSNAFSSGAMHCQFTSAGVLKVSISGATSQDTDFGTSANWPTGTWTHVAVVYNSTAKTLAVYANGVQVGSTTSLSVAPAFSGAAGGIGSWSSAGRELNGQIDNFTIYSRALSAEELVTLTAQSGAPELCKVILTATSASTQMTGTLNTSSFDSLRFHAWSAGGSGGDIEGAQFEVAGGGGGGGYSGGLIIEAGEWVGVAPELSRTLSYAVGPVISISPQDAPGTFYMVKGDDGSTPEGPGSGGSVFNDDGGWASTQSSVGGTGAFVDTDGGGGGNFSGGGGGGAGFTGNGDDGSGASRSGGAGNFPGGRGGDGGIAGSGDPGIFPGGGGGGAGRASGLDGSVGGGAKLMLIWELGEEPPADGGRIKTGWLPMGMHIAI